VTRQSAEQGIPEHDGIVVGFVVCGEHEGDWTLARERAQLCKFVGMTTQLDGIAPPELLPAAGIVTEPGTQCVTRRDGLGPMIDRGVGLANAAWPQPIDQYPGTVTARRRLVGAFQADPGRRDPLFHRNASLSLTPK
jgi:hypothetical protein